MFINPRGEDITLARTNVLKTVLEYTDKKNAMFPFREKIIKLYENES